MKIAKELYTLWTFAQDIAYTDLSIALFDTDLGAKSQKFIETSMNIAINDKLYNIILFCFTIILPSSTISH